MRYKRLPSGLVVPRHDDDLEVMQALAEATGARMGWDYPVTTGGGGATATSAANVATAESLNNVLVYSDLTTPGPAVTVVVGASGKVIVTLSCLTQSNTLGAVGFMSVALSGGNVVAAADANANQVEYRDTAVNWSCVVTQLFTGLAAGSTTFTAKYRESGNSITQWSSRVITVLPL